MTGPTAPPFNPLAPAVRADPFAAYRELHRHEPVQWNPAAQIWFLARHDHAAAMLRDGRYSAEHGQAIRPAGRPATPTMLTADPPEHGRLRRPVVRALGAELVAGVRARLGDFAEVLLDRMAPRDDLVTALTVPAALFAFADLAGLPVRDAGDFRDAALGSAAVLDPFASPAQHAAAAASTERLTELLDGTALAGAIAGTADGTLDREEVLAAATLVVVGGMAPLESFLALAVRNLLLHGDGWTELAASPGLASAAVPELLRLDSPIPFVARVAAEEAEAGGRPVAAGQRVVALLVAANRDPAAYPDPDDLVIGRDGPAHLAFGAGPHVCPGAPLARAVAVEVLGRLAGRYPGLRLAGGERWDAAVVPRRLASLPVVTR